MSSFEVAEAALASAQSQPSTESQSDSSQPESTKSADPSSTDGQPSISEIMELDKLEKFKFEGREWTPHELKSAYMMQQDYSRKTAEVAQERKYYDNLAADLESVRNDPSLSAKFRELYPQKYHNYLSHVLPKDQTPQVEASRSNVPPEVANRIEKLEQFINQFETKNLEAEIDSTFTKLGEKYPMADEQTVTARADLAMRQGVQLRGQDGKLNVGELEKIFKAEHDRTQKAYDAHYAKQVEQQKAASAKSRDVAGGGGVPGQAPEKLTFEQATQKAIKEFSARH